MLQGKLVDLILLRVNGGNLTDDSAVQRADIRAYLPIALNFATTKFYFTNKKEEYNRDFPSYFYTSFPNLTISRTGSIPTITLPKVVLQFAGNQGIRNLQDDFGNTYTPVQDGEVSMINYYKDVFPNTRLFLQMGQTVQLWNVTKFATTVNAIVILDPSQYTDNDELPIAAGLEADVIDLCVQHFSAQRQQPADVDVNKQDLNAS
jgi:hypothetical protein